MSEEVTLDTSNFLSNPATCVACDSSEGTKYTSFRLSCGHSLCSVHFAEVSTSRGCSTSYCCPRLSCGQFCKSVEVVQLEAHEKRTRNNSSKLFARERSESFTLALPEKDLDPTRYFLSQNDAGYKSNTMNMSMTFPVPDEVTDSFKILSVDLPMQETILYSEEQKSVLEAMFTQLHTSIFNHDNLELQVNGLLRSKGCHVGPKLLKSEAEHDTSFLRRLLAAFSCGQPLESMRTDHQDWKNRRNFTYTLTEVARFCNTRKPRVLQEAIAEVLKLTGVPPRAAAFMQQFGVCGSLDASSLKDAAQSL